jgi:hypothetical protein
MLNRLMKRLGSFLVEGVFLAGLGLSVGLSGSAHAAPNPPQQPEPQKVSNAQLVQGLQVLRSIKVLLEGADHDYGGHRVDAIKAIGAAQHQLKLALETQQKGKRPGTPGAKGGKSGKKSTTEPERQAISDAQLGDTIGTLQQTVAFLKKADHDYGGHRVQAIKDLGVAIEQLQTALKFVKKSGK